jgi:two-component system NtrC family response regulator
MTAGTSTSPLGRVVVVDDDPLLVDQLRWSLAGVFEMASAGDAASARPLLDSHPDLFLFDLRLPPSGTTEEGFRLLREARRLDPDATVIVMSGEEDRQAALRAIDLGAFDFFRKPVDPAELLVILKRALERRRLAVENREWREAARGTNRFDEMLGESPAMKRLFKDIERVAPSDATVLIEGESGTGKELVARSIHQRSARGAGPFVAVNASAMPDTLAESELFGHERGAFTGAVASRPGRFELAQGGTLFLDEVGTLSAAVQAKLLRVLEVRQLERLGGRRTISVDFRLISASNEDLAGRVRTGAFREDLFYRIHTVVLRVPPLRERSEDVAPLAEHFRNRYATKYRRPARRFAPELLERLRTRAWKGNVRELEHVVEMLVLFGDGEELVPEDLARALAGEDEAPTAPAAQGGEAAPGSFAGRVRDFERRLLTDALAQAGGSKAQAARALGLDSNQMKYLCRKYGV